jgi:hypothetical protein
MMGWRLLSTQQLVRQLPHGGLGFNQHYRDQIKKHAWAILDHLVGCTV